MFDFSFSEMILVGVVALVVLGPERLPKVARFVGVWVGKIQSMSANIKNELAQHADYAELSKIKNDFTHAANEIQNNIKALEQDVPAWERLPEIKTPADFGVDEHGAPLEYPKPVLSGFYVKSLKKQAMQRKRAVRPRPNPKPKLRMRK